MCCNHFSWYCFISFTIFSAPVFSLIHWFFLYLVLLFQEGVLKVSSVLLLNVVPLFSSVPRLRFEQMGGGGVGRVKLASDKTRNREVREVELCFHLSFYGHCVYHTISKPITE
jgi:hypothetical protein